MTLSVFRAAVVTNGVVTNSVLDWEITTLREQEGKWTTAVGKTRNRQCHKRKQPTLPDSEMTVLASRSILRALSPT